MPWDNTVLHNVMPVAALVDWLLSGSAAAAPYRQALPWLAVPLLHLVVVIDVDLAPLTWVVASAPRWVPATA